MASEIKIDLTYLRIYNDGRIERLPTPPAVPPSDDPNAAVRTKDVVIDSESGVSARIYAPRRHDPPRKLPVMVYIHGGAFCVGSAFVSFSHNFVSAVVEKAGVIAVSAEYRLAPENPIPIPYDDSWTVFRWTAAHAGGDGSEPWLNELADFRRVYIGGESAGANIATDVALRAGVEELAGVEVAGLFLLHPYFGLKGEDILYKYLCPGSSGGDDDPRVNPAVDPRIGRMAGRRVMFAVAENDSRKERAVAYCAALQKSAWGGEVEMMETEREGHVFYLFDLTAEKSVAVIDRLVEFLK
ncbi:probable carboxylesterase 12 [Andrographis paniculata]|uniref:probable carboxylesterase 12 n=1 Tax=Andrographis paniculata TaxID=175694 RepID=UPI0021E9AEE1|nr:probable carboxylesterase 12 [Andrographis paniculata]